MRKLRSIQVLRGLAACGVVMLHAYMSQGTARYSDVRIGSAGVDLFFVISGFIIATVAPGKTPRQFLTDRAWRIYPLWLIAVLPWVIARQPPWQMWITSLTLWPMFGRFTLPALELGWTLSFEMLFYLAATLVLLTRPAIPIALFFLALIAGAITKSPLFDWVGNPLIFEFLMGVAIARLPKFPKAGPLAVLTGIALFAISPLFLYDGHLARNATTSILRVVCWGVPAALVVYGCLSLDERIKWPSFAVTLGDASYSIYLFHPLALVIIPGFIAWPVKMLLAIGLGVFAHFQIERRLSRQNLKRPRRETARRRAAT